MVSQGFIGALQQYFTIEEKPRLHRRNSWFRDHQISEILFLKVGAIGVATAITIITYWCVMGVCL